MRPFVDSYIRIRGLADEHIVGNIVIGLDLEKTESTIFDLFPLIQLCATAPCFNMSFNMDDKEENDKAALDAVVDLKNNSLWSSTIQLMLHNILLRFSCDDYGTSAAVEIVIKKAYGEHFKDGTLMASEYCNGRDR